MSLKEQGFRYMVNRERDRYGWFHPADIEALKQSNWIDCTDMTNAELQSYFEGSKS